MDSEPVLFDAVIFDLDGTLVSTELFWVDAARAGALRAFAELGLERELPAAEDWLSMVGLPLSEGFDAVFADLEPASRRRVMELCVEEEELALRAGGAALMPGARELLRSLVSQGVQLGIASNCGRGYLETMLGGLGLSEFVREARCLDSRGVRHKADMLADLLRTFGTRSAVMVGDRSGDADAAHANGLPHVHLEGPIKPRGEGVECEARIAGLDELLGVLGGRARWISAALDELGLVRGGAAAVRTVGISGAPQADLGTFARDATRLLEARGRGVRVLDALTFRAAAAGPGEAADAWADELDVEGLIDTVLEPHAAGRPVAGTRLGGVPLAADDLLVLAGPWLLHPRLRLFLDRVVYLSLPEQDCLARAVALAGELEAAEAALELRRRVLPRLRRHEAECDPLTRADLVLDARNPLGAG